MRTASWAATPARRGPCDVIGAVDALAFRNASSTYSQLAPAPQASSAAPPGPLRPCGASVLVPSCIPERWPPGPRTRLVHHKPPGSGSFPARRPTPAAPSPLPPKAQSSGALAAAWARGLRPARPRSSAPSPLPASGCFFEPLGAAAPRRHEGPAPRLALSLLEYIHFALAPYPLGGVRLTLPCAHPAVRPARLPIPQAPRPRIVAIGRRPRVGVFPPGVVKAGGAPVAPYCRRIKVSFIHHNEEARPASGLTFF